MASLRSSPLISPSARRKYARSIWFPHPGAIELREELLPDVGPEDVRIRTLVSGISQGTEMLVFRGQVAPDLELDLPTLEGSFDFPIKYGYASVGRVVEAGEGVTSLRSGDLVFVHHPHQNEYVIPASQAHLLPDNLARPEFGVFVANLQTAVNVMLDAAPRLGERVVIFGQGVVGLLLTQLVKLTGADRVIVVEPSAFRRQLTRDVGADIILEPGSGLAQAVRDQTDGIGADIVIEASGKPAALRQAIDLAVFQGTIVICSWYGREPVALDLGGAFHRRRLRLVSSQVSNIDPALQPRWHRDRCIELAMSLLGRLRLEPLITHRIPYQEAATAYALLTARPADVGQVVLTYPVSD